MAKQTISDKQKLKKLFIVSLVLWLAALPLVALFQIILRFILNGIGSPDAVIAVVNIVSILIGLYGLLGWIPTTVIFIMYLNKK